MWMSESRKKFKDLYKVEIQCIWYSLLGHAFLTELWIEHNWLDLPDHSALEVIIWWTKYYFDATGNDQLLEFEYWEKIWEYSKINWKWWIFWIPQFAIKWNPEKILLSHIFNNKWTSLLNSWRYKESKEMFDSAIELNPTYTQAYYNKWTVLLFLERYEEAIEMFDRAIELNPTESGYYYWKWIVLGKRWKRELWELYKYSSYLLEWKQVKENDNYTKEKQKIKQYIESKDHELIIKYLIELEKDSNYDLLSAEDYFLS